MKTEVTNHPPVYQPVSITITFETAAELFLFRDLCGSNNTVSRSMAHLMGPDRDAISEMLSSIFRKLL